MNRSICVLCPYGLDRGLLSKAVSLADKQPVHIFLPEHDISAAASCGATAIHSISDFPLDEAQTAIWLKERILQLDCTVVLAPATIQIRNIMPMLAWHLKAGLTADCTNLIMDGSVLLQTRPAFGNSLMATIKSNSAIQMATVRPGTFQYIERSNPSPQIIHEHPEQSGSHIILAQYNAYKEGVPLNQANIILAGGLGIGSKEGFRKLERLAKAINATVAASRNAVDAGYAPYRCQVGMTGVSVCPKLYIAIGISGAVQHLAGMSGSEKVIAINSDPKAPIFDYADYGIVTDWESVIDQLLEELS